MQINECPEDESEWEKTFEIQPLGLTEKLEVRVKLICECECEKTDYPGVANIGPPVSTTSGLVWVLCVSVCFIFA